MHHIKDIIKQTRAHYCLDCGKCTAVCPVNRFDQNFSPRLVVQKALRDQDSAYSDPNIWSCVACSMCMTRCNYNVHYVDLIRFLRMKSRDNGTELVCSHAGITESVMHLMSDRDTKQDRSAWLPSGVKLEESGDTAFFVGCAPYFDVIFQELGVKSTEGPIGAMRLLNRAGVPFGILPNERCCGHDLILAGDLDGFIKLGHANIAELHGRGIKKIITSCPECYYTLKVDYHRYFDGWNIEVQHITELPEVLKLASHIKGVKKVTFHDSCKLGRNFKIYDQPRQLLRSAGAELVEMENSRENALCCGASPWAFCGSVNKQIQDERLRQARATGAEILVTSCPKCRIHLTCAQAAGKQEDAKISIMDIYYLVSRNQEPKEKK